MPAFTRDGSVTRDYLWWFHDGNRAIRIGDWKLVANHQGLWELYNLRSDRAESRNLAVNHADKVRELEQAWARHTEAFRALATADGKGALPAKTPTD